VGAATSIINATTHPAGKLDAWRQRVVCLFGLGLNGSPINTSPHSGDVNLIANQYDPTGQVSCPGTGWNQFTSFDESGATTGSSAISPQVDRLPLEATVGWDANLNGNLAELLQEPSLMGALEGAGITVLSKGVVFPSDPYDSTLLAGFPTGTTLLQNVPGVSSDYCYVTTVSSTGVVTENTTELSPNPYPSNFMCNPSSIDALGITQSSQGGGGIFIHGWGHNLQVANNRIYSNAGTLSGGINVGQGEFPPAYIQGSTTNAAPGSCEDSPIFNATLPYCQNVNINMHNNFISLNSSTGDELFSATPAGAGGVSICTGADYYKFNYNWVCGNLSSGDGGGLGHIGFSFNGDIEHNTIIFNQSLNPTIPANGGGLVVMGAPDADIVCNGNANIDTDCAPFGAPGGIPGNTPVGQIGPSDGVGPGLVINANLIMGNAAETGTGAGIAFNQVNGSDMVAFPTDPGQWNTVTVTNNIIVNNVGGWDGAGISLLDSPNVNIINNTIAYNNSTATAGILFNTLGGPLASQGGTSCNSTATTTCPQPAGLVAIQHGAVLAANLPTTLTVTCPPGHFQPGTSATNGSCKTVSYPKLENNIFWHNASFYIGVGALSPAFQQNVISLFNSFAHSAVTSQPAADATTGTTSVTITGGTGACVTGTQYWDIGIRGDTSQTPGTLHLAPSDSVLTSITGYAGGNSAGNPNFLRQYCDGSRIAPETPKLVGAGWLVPPGISDATVPNPLFNLTPAATVDEGNNWVNLRWGPLTMSNPTVLGTDGNYGGGPLLGNYAITTGSSAISRVGPGTNFADAPAYDFFDKPRKPGATIDAGAVQFSGGGAIGSEFTVSPASLDFGLVPDHSPTTTDQDIQIIDSDNVPISFNNASFTITGASAVQFTIQSNTCIAGNGTTTIAPGEACVVNVVFNPSLTQGVRNATLNITTIGGATQTVALTGHDTIATVSVSALTPPMNPTPASAVAITGTITLANTIALTNPNAGPFTPTAITITPVSGTGTWATGGTCAVGTPVAPQTNCTVTVTYTPPATGTLTGTARLTVSQYGTNTTTPVINNLLITAN
ncbi:MAG: hypothetical protein WBL63_04735, partial [Candidatus Acidiferrum sp.]